MENQLNVLKKAILLARKTQLQEVITTLNKMIIKFKLEYVEKDFQFIKHTLIKISNIDTYDDFSTELDIFTHQFNDILNYYIYKESITGAKFIYGKTIDMDCVCDSDMLTTLIYIGTKLQLI